MRIMKWTPVFILVCLSVTAALTSSSFSAQKAPVPFDDLFFDMDELNAEVALSGRQFYIPIRAADFPGRC